MSQPPIVIDSNVFRDLSFINWLRSYHSRKVIPAIAYTEVLVYVTSVRGKTAGSFDALLRTAGIEIEWYRKEQARSAARFGADGGDFSQNARDYMIAAHASLAPWVVITNNIQDFSFLGDRVKTPYEFKGLFS